MKLTRYVTVSIQDEDGRSLFSVGAKVKVVYDLKARSFHAYEEGKAGEGAGGSDLAAILQWIGSLAR